MSDVRVVVVDDHAVARRSIIALLRSVGGIEVVGEAFDGKMALQRTTECQPDLVLLDASMPRMDGLTVLQTFQTQAHSPYVIIFSGYVDTSLAVEAFAAGARGVLIKTHSPNELAQAIRLVMAGERVLSRELKSLPMLAQRLDGDIQGIPQ